MAEFPLVMNAGDFLLEKIAPTFENAHTVFTLIDGQREYLAQWLNRIEIRVDTENQPSQAVARRAGYAREGVLRKFMMLHGVPRDIVVFAKTK